jgi:hypothetical protein
MGKTPANKSRPPQPPPDLGELLDPDLLLALAEIDEADLEEAVRWFDEHASPEWRGALGGDTDEPD